MARLSIMGNYGNYYSNYRNYGNLMARATPTLEMGSYPRQNTAGNMSICEIIINDQNYQNKLTKSS